MLDDLAGVATPSYRRAELKAGILHFGVGNFHRAHQAVYLDRLFNIGRDRDWAVIGGGVMPSDAAMRAALARQDYLTTVVEQSAEESRARITGAMVDMIAPGDRDRLLACLTYPQIRIVSMTITEGGYFIDAATGSFDASSPAIAADATDPRRPTTVFGYIVEGLRLRRASGTAPFTVMSCDNIPHNGVVARNAVVGLARLCDPGLANWIEDHVAFPNGMVDRITPATSDRERTVLADQFGIEDAWPVFCEDFIQWVLEDRFPAGRPALEAVGVQFVPDVTPFEQMKIRILNGGHAAIAYPAGLMGIRFAHEAMGNPTVLAFLRKVEREEIIPTLPPVPGTDLDEYYQLIERRFSNPKIGDTVRRLCLDGSNRQPKFIIATIAVRLAANAPVAGLALASALWCRYCVGSTEAGEAIEPNDPNWDRLSATARAALDDPMAWLAMEDIYGAVGRSSQFREVFARCLDLVMSVGVAGAIDRYLAGEI